MSDATTAVRWLLQQAEPEARRVAVQQIAKVQGPDAAELLLRALADDDWRVRKEGALVAPVLERREEVVAALVVALEETVNIGLRNAAVEALVAIGADAVTATVGAMSRLDGDARKLAVEVLGGVADVRCTVALVRALDDEDDNVRVAAAEALGNASLAGEESRDMATRALLGALPTVDPFLGIGLLESLSRLDARLPWRVVEPYANDPMLRRYAIAAASGSREPEAVRALARAAADPSSTIAREAIVALGEVVAGAADDAALLSLAREVLDETEGAKASARRVAVVSEDLAGQNGALTLLGLLRDVDDIPLLVAALGEEVAERAELGLRLFGRDAIAPLLVAARGAKPSVRAATLNLAMSLGGAEDPAVREALRAGIDDPSAEVVASVVETLAPVGDAEDLRRVAAMVGHEDDRIAAAAAHAVWELATRHVDVARALLDDPPSGHDPVALTCILLGGIASAQRLGDDDVRVLERALIHDRPQVRRAAIDALAQAGGDAAADAVVFALADEENEVRLAAVRALGRLGRAEPLVGVVAQARDPVLTGAALRALADADAVRAVTAACLLVRHADTAIACAAVEAIGGLSAAQLSSPWMTASEAAACEDALFVALDHPSPEVVKLALSLVGAQTGPRALARLALCLDHGSWEVRRVAAELLGQHKGAGAHALLRARYERERDPLVRGAIAAAVSVRPPDREGGVVTPLRPKEGD
jgi:HEAT repeat protein